MFCCGVLFKMHIKTKDIHPNHPEAALQPSTNGYLTAEPDQLPQQSYLSTTFETWGVIPPSQVSYRSSFKTNSLDNCLFPNRAPQLPAALQHHHQATLADPIHHQSGRQLAPQSGHHPPPHSSSYQQSMYGTWGDIPLVQVRCRSNILLDCTKLTFVPVSAFNLGPTYTRSHLLHTDFCHMQSKTIFIPLRTHFTP